VGEPRAATVPCFTSERANKRVACHAVRMSARGAMTQERVAPTALSFQCSWHGATAREGDCIRRLAGAYPFLDDICSNPSGVPTFLRVSCAVVTAELLGWRAKVRGAIGA